jgi:hypothetical protein
LLRAREAGLIPYQLQARLAMGQIQMEGGEAGRARTGLEQLSKDAKQSGYKLVASKADALLAAKPRK